MRPPGIERLRSRAAVLIGAWQESNLRPAASKAG